MRVFLGLAEVSGFYSNLAKGFKEIGVYAELVTLTQHKFGYQDNHPSKIVKVARYAVSKRIQADNRNFLSKMGWSLLAGLTRVVLFVWAIARFDVFIFGCATSFFRLYELPILKLFGKKIIYNFHGTDGRCAFMDGFAEDTFMPRELCEGTGYIGPLRTTDSQTIKKKKLEAYRDITKKRKKTVAQIDKYADVIINSPSHGQHHTRKFVQRLIMGMPYAPDKDLTSKVGLIKKDVVTILHSPSFPEGKGTPEIRKAIHNLQSKGLNIDFIEVTGRPNREVLELLIECDFVIDQLYSDMAMVGFATEAAFFGKPAIVGGYYSRHQNRDIAKHWIPPTLFCLPEELESSIAKMILDVKYRQALGEKAKAYVESKWVASESAKRFLMLAEGDFPEEWLFDPACSNYILGMGMSKDKIREIMKGMIENFGVKSFMLSDKPQLENAIVKFANSKT